MLGQVMAGVRQFFGGSPAPSEAAAPPTVPAGLMGSGIEGAPASGVGDASGEAVGRIPQRKSTKARIESLMLEAKTRVQDEARGMERQTGLPLILEDIRRRQQHEAEIQERVAAAAAELRQPGPTRPQGLEGNLGEGIAGVIALLSGRQPGQVAAATAAQIDQRQQKAFEDALRETARQDQGRMTTLGILQDQLGAVRGDRRQSEQMAAGIRGALAEAENRTLNQYRERGFRLEDLDEARRLQLEDRTMDREDRTALAKLDAELANEAYRSKAIFEEQVIKPLQERSAFKGAIVKAGIEGLMVNEEEGAVDEFVAGLKEQGVSIPPGYVAFFKKLAVRNRDSEDFKREMAKAAYGLDMVRAQAAAAKGGPLVPEGADAGMYGPLPVGDGSAGVGAGVPGSRSNPFPGGRPTGGLPPVPGATFRPAPGAGAGAGAPAVAGKAAWEKGDMVAGVRLPTEREPRLEKASALALRDLRQATGNYWVIADEVAKMEEELRRAYVTEDPEKGARWNIGERRGLRAKDYDSVKEKMVSEIEKGRAKMSELKATHRAALTAARASLPLEYWQWAEAWRERTLAAIKALAEERTKGSSSASPRATAQAQEALRRRYSQVTGVDFEVKAR